MQSFVEKEFVSVLYQRQLHVILVTLIHRFKESKLKIKDWGGGGYNGNTNGISLEISFPLVKNQNISVIKLRGIFRVGKSMPDRMASEAP